MHFKEVWYDCIFFSLYKCSGHLKTLSIDCQQDHFGFSYVPQKPERLEYMRRRKEILPFLVYLIMTTEEEMNTVTLFIPSLCWVTLGKIYTWVLIMSSTK